MVKYPSREQLSKSDVPALSVCPVLGLHLLFSDFLAKLLSLKTTRRVNLKSLNFLAYAVFRLVLKENYSVKKLRSFIGTDMKWTSTYIKRINYTQIYAETHYHQCTEMFPKLTKGRIMLLRHWEVKQWRRLNFSNNLNEPQWVGDCLPSTHEGWALVVPATCPGKQEHLTVCDRSSIRFLLQQRCTATTSHVPCFTWCWPNNYRDKWWRAKQNISL